MAGKKHVGVILSGCGHQDGAEISESVLCLLALDEADAEVHCYAPNKTLEEVDHLQGKPTGGERNVLIESARIARGRIKDLRQAKAADMDAWVLPGGYGAAKNLCTFADQGAAGDVDPDVMRVLQEALQAKIPVGACCIAPALLGLVAKAAGKSVKLTIGNDQATAQVLESLGMQHVQCPAHDSVVDHENRVVTTPAYMYDARLSDISKGIHKLVQEVLKMA